MSHNQLNLCDKHFPATATEGVGELTTASVGIFAHVAIVGDFCRAQYEMRNLVLRGEEVYRKPRGRGSESQTDKCAAKG